LRKSTTYLLKKKELINLLENNIADERRKEIAAKLAIAKRQEKENKMVFSSELDQLKQNI